MPNILEDGTQPTPNVSNCVGFGITANITDVHDWEKYKSDISENRITLWN